MGGNASAAEPPAPAARAPFCCACGGGDDAASLATPRPPHREPGTAEAVTDVRISTAQARPFSVLDAGPLESRLLDERNRLLDENESPLREEDQRRLQDDERSLATSGKSTWTRGSASSASVASQNGFHDDEPKRGWSKIRQKFHAKELKLQNTGWKGRMRATVSQNGHKPRTTQTKTDIWAKGAGTHLRNAQMRAGGGAGAADGPSNVFSKLHEMQDAERMAKAILMDKYEVKELYNTESPSGRICTHYLFEQLTLLVIFANAVWIGYDADWNGKEPLEAKTIFQVAENVFCTFFTFEVGLRFLAFFDKWEGLRDSWFRFDFFLVFVMVVETWVIPLALWSSQEGLSEDVAVGGGLLTLMRTLRLARLTRMVRVMRAMPEVLFLVRGIYAALRFVAVVLLLIVIIIYVFALVFARMYGMQVPGGFQYECSANTTRLQDPEEFEPNPACAWRTVARSMMMLFLSGALFDEMAGEVAAMWDLNPLLVPVFFCFVILCNFTLLNMLIGMMCEVIEKVASAEKEKAMIIDTKRRLEALEVDVDHDNEVSPEEFLLMLTRPEVSSNLQKIGVEPKHYDALTAILFEVEDEPGVMRPISFTTFVETIVRLRPVKGGCSIDIACLRFAVRSAILQVKDEQVSRLQLFHDLTNHANDRMKAVCKSLSGVCQSLDKAERRLERGRRAQAARLRSRAADGDGRPPDPG